MSFPGLSDEGNLQSYEFQNYIESLFKIHGRKKTISNSNDEQFVDLEIFAGGIGSLFAKETHYSHYLKEQSKFSLNLFGGLYMKVMGIQLDPIIIFRNEKEFISLLEKQSSEIISIYSGIFDLSGFNKLHPDSSHPTDNVRIKLPNGIFIDLVSSIHMEVTITGKIDFIPESFTGKGVVKVFLAILSTKKICLVGEDGKVSTENCIENMVEFDGETDIIIESHENIHYPIIRTHLSSEKSTFKFKVNQVRKGSVQKKEKLKLYFEGVCYQEQFFAIL